MEPCYTHLADMSALKRKKYIHKIEKDYEATFVRHKEACDLIQEVKLKLERQIAINTQNWDMMERAYRK
jgi:hypothetical protein